jgi:hypothetical protein
MYVTGGIPMQKLCINMGYVSAAAAAAAAAAVRVGEPVWL